MRRRWLLLGCVGIAVLGSCGAGDETLAPGCTDGDQVRDALAQAPRPVALSDGTRLSECVVGASTPALLQELGATLTAIAEELEVRAASDEEAALRLGYLIGAIRRGAPRTAGQGTELARRLERSGASAEEPAVASALGRGMRAGEASG